MKILFMGTPDFAQASLKALYDGGFDVCGVFTQPDKPKSRGYKTEFTPVKKLATEHNTPVFQPVKLRDGAALKIVEELNPDIIVVVAYGRLLPSEILDYPKYGCVNIHGSILPKYRGSAPIQWSVLNGDKKTGVTAMFMNEKMDEGDIIDIIETEIGAEETSGELFDRLMALGAELLCKTIRNIEKGTYNRTKQSNEGVSYAPPLTKDLCPIDWNLTADEIVNRVRGLNPWPSAAAVFGGTAFKVHRARKIDGRGTAGEIMYADKRGLAVYCSDGAVEIVELQAAGGKRMASADYLRGHSLC